MVRQICVTGIAGFIGFHLAQALVAQGDEVIGVDNFNDYYTPLLKESRAALLEKAGVKVYRGEITDSRLLEEITREQGTTHFVHLAAQAGVRYSLEAPHIYIQSNIAGFLTVLELCRQREGMRLVYASSSSVYGLNTTTPFSEEHRCDAQASLYGVTKKSNELMAHSYHHLFGIPAIGLRFFTVYGPWGRPDMAYFSFAQAMTEGRTIQLFNHGNVQRDFTYIDDIIQGVLAAIHSSIPWGVYNLGNSQPQPLHALIDALEQALGVKAKKEEVAMQPGDVLTTYAETTASERDLGYAPQVSLQEGIGHFAQWFLKHASSFSSLSHAP